MTETERAVESARLAIDRARAEGRRMAHLADKAASDAKNFREIAKMLPAGKHRDYMNDLAWNLEQATTREPLTEEQFQESIRRDSSA